jgi:O-antigen ligase
MILGTLYTGYQAWEAPVWKFSRARLDGIGGPDFRESSFLGAHFAMMLPLIGVQFLRCGWRGKALCLAAGGFAMNGLILTRTRAAFVAMCVGAVAAALLALRGKRRKILAYIVPGLLATVFLTDVGVRERMRTISMEPKAGDSSASNRLLIWEASGRMFLEHPLGVGIGNFSAEMGRFNDRVHRRDAHSAYVRCAGELGVPGVTLMAALVLSALACLRRARSLAWSCPNSLQLRYYIYGVSISLLVMLTSGLFMTQLYIEEFWWILTLPVCVLRAAEAEYQRAREVVEEEFEDAPEGLLQPQPALAGLGVC